MATFPSTPEASFPVVKQQEPNLKISKLGDGYEERLLFGLNQNPRIYNLSWVNITLTELDTFMTFLNARALDNASFTYTPPGESSSAKFVAEPGYKQSINFANRGTLNATFREVFEP
tara:strand:+ start:179 stop:529 length:351 start_codon:yes stop_codon:yes gene_type:complete